MTTIEPCRLDRALADGQGLDPISGWPDGVRVSGAEPTHVTSWFEGQVTAQVIEIADGVLRFTNVDFDEICVVLNGDVTLTPDGGAPATFEAGEIYAIPKGFTGTFAPRGRYRAMTVMSTAALKALLHDWNITMKP